MILKFLLTIFGLSWITARKSFALRIVALGNFGKLLLCVEDVCVTPDNKSGICQPLSTCSRLQEIWDSRPLSWENREFLKSSRCSASGHRFCCAKEMDSTTAPPIPGYMKNLLKFLPQPPHCGGDSQDRIFGGSITKINEYPWTVLLKHEKRENCDEREIFDWINLENYHHKADGSSGFHCSGTLINNRYVITGKQFSRKFFMVSSIQTFSCSLRR